MNLTTTKKNKKNKYQQEALNTGLKIIELKESKGSRKKPIGAWLNSIITKAKDSNYGVMLGSDGHSLDNKYLVVIDIDNNPDYHLDRLKTLCPSLEKTYIIKTAKGYHIYCLVDSKLYKQVSKSSKLYYKENIYGDLKTTGYVVGEGSQHDTDIFYTNYQNSRKDVITIDFKVLDMFSEKSPSKNKGNLSSESISLVRFTGYLSQFIKKLKENHGLFEKNDRDHKALSISFSCFTGGLTVKQTCQVIKSLQKDSEGFNSNHKIKAYVNQQYQALSKKNLNILQGQKQEVKFDKTIDKQYLPKIENSKNVIIQSPTGTGKTTCSLNEKTIYLTTNKSLVQNVSREHHLLSYKDTKDTKIKNGFAVTAKSLLNYDYDKSIKRIVIDEASQFLKTLFKSNLYGKNEKVKILEKLNEFKKNGKQFVFLDNHYSQADFTLIKKFLGEDIESVKNTYKPKEKELLSFVKKESLLNYLDNKLSNKPKNETVLFYVSTRKETNQFYNLFKKDFKVLKINTHTVSDNEDVESVLNDTKLMREYDLVIYNQAIGRGVDLNYSWIKDIFCLITYKEISPRDNVQALKRARQSERIHLFISQNKNRPKIINKEERRQAYLDNYNINYPLSENKKNIFDDIRVHKLSEFVNKNKETFTEYVVEKEMEENREKFLEKETYEEIFETENIKGDLFFGEPSDYNSEKAFTNLARYTKLLVEEIRQEIMKSGYFKEYVENLNDPMVCFNKRDFVNEKERITNTIACDHLRSRGVTGWFDVGKTEQTRNRRLEKSRHLFKPRKSMGEHLPHDSFDEWGSQKLFLNIFSELFFNIDLNTLMRGDLKSLQDEIDTWLKKQDRNHIYKKFCKYEKEIRRIHPNFDFCNVQKAFSDGETMINNLSDFFMTCYGLKLEHIGKGENRRYRLCLDHILTLRECHSIDIHEFFKLSFKGNTMNYINIWLEHSVTNLNELNKLSKIDFLQTIRACESTPYDVTG